jgi:hypothetical protein
MALDLQQDHPAILWGNWPGQFDRSVKLSAVMRGLASPFGGLQAALLQLSTQRWLDTAVGAQLDGIGDILGRPRQITDVVAYRFFGFLGQPNIGGFGQYRLYSAGLATTGGTSTLDDDAYRLLLRWKILVDSAGGTAPQIAAACGVLFQAGAIAVEDIGPAAIKVHVTVTNSENVFLGNPLRWIAPAAGVSVEFRAYDEGEDFDFAAGNTVRPLIGADGARLMGADGYQLIARE